MSLPREAAAGRWSSCGPPDPARAILPPYELPANWPQPQTRDNQYPEPLLPLPEPTETQSKSQPPWRETGLRVAPGWLRPFRPAQRPASLEVAAKPAALLRQPLREGQGAGGGVWGTAIMWLTSDSRTASPIPSSYSRQGSPPAQELGGETAPTGLGEKSRGEAALRQGCRLARMLPHCPPGHAEAETAGRLRLPCIP